MKTKRLISLSEELMADTEEDLESPMEVIATAGDPVPTTTIFPDGETTMVSAFQMTLFTPQGAIVLTRHPMPSGSVPVRVGDSIKFTYEVKFNRKESPDGTKSPGPGVSG